MIARDVRARSGITLTEILISILIMGVGLISLATLFPLGLIRLREATRSSRAGLAFETAADDMDIRALFYKPTFSQNTWYWGQVNNAALPRDPFVQDAFPINCSISGAIASGSLVIPSNNVFTGVGLPFCYDPLWRSITGVMPYPAPTNNGLIDPTLAFSTTYVNNVTPDEARFGAGLFSNGSVPFLPNDYADGNAPSAHGLQRLTNFIPWVSQATVPGSLNSVYPFTTTNSIYSAANQPADVAGSVFSSNDDIVFNTFTGNANNPSPLIPDMSTGGPQADYRFTWFVTGRQNDDGANGAQFVGEIVVCDGRTFGWDPIPGQTYNAPAGETVVEAIYAYGANISNILDANGNPTGTGFAQGSDRTVLLRWRNTMPDPQVRVGGWICDTTYERNVATYATRYRAPNAPLSAQAFARCKWYQVGKKTDPQVDVLGIDATFRTMVLTINSPVQARSLLNTKTGLPVHVNVALVMPSVINVFPRAFEVHTIALPGTRGSD